MTAQLQIPHDEANRVLNAAIERGLFGNAPLTVVKSPPGAGKTFLVECACAVAVAAPAMRVVVVTPGVSQLYDIAERLLAYRLPRLELAHANHRTLPASLDGRITVSTPGTAQGPGVLVTNADKLAAHLHVLSPGTP